MASTPKPRAGLARETARTLLEKYGVKDPPVPVDEIVKAEGLTVRDYPWGRERKVSGLLLRDRKLIVINRDDPPVRKRFSLAHELGHFALHHHLIRAEMAVVDIDHPPDGSEAHDDPVLESEANIFAGELLVPRSLLLRFRSPTKKADEPEAAAFNNPFSALSEKLGKKAKPLSEVELAKLFNVSKETMFIALQNHRVL